MSDVWTVPKFSRTRVDKAGEILRDLASGEAARLEATEVISNWRASHSYPLNTLQMLLRSRARSVDERSTIAQRLKRLPSIENKLARFGTMNVTQIQDVGGCRAVVLNVHRVRRLQSLFMEQPTAHELVGCDDYVESPQADGYRGVHLVYRHFSGGRPEYDRLLIEVQLRSRLQHIWATAVETVDTFEHESLKVKKGSPEWERFFALMATALALKERAPIVPGTPGKRTVLREEIRELARELEVRKKLLSYRSTLGVSTQPGLREAHTFMLDLQPDKVSNEFALTITGYAREQREEALRDYSSAEEALRGRPGAHVVLVTVQSLRKLRGAYPNYFLDTQRFVRLMTEAMN